ncbi:cysteine hydrolase family protein [Hymenobacter cellulosilyticus]|uniref:Cysteine hydrolase n=1 Tax=Hymenobacter cellulosilyticus TaxID=2932248 RepID=A0A8T9Q1G7_9BACT|nr:cysteine hydrolase family protein [Hymenobacter cellulosilyticus]UOQ71247.1 cysteine hydrolase [Hymenobacter cellulosilyticus]
MQHIPALLLIDFQQAFDNQAYWGGNRNNPQAEANAGRLLAQWRQLGWPVIHIRHDSASPASPLRPGQPGNAFKTEVQPEAGEPIFAKTVNSAFIGTGLQAYLAEHNIHGLFIAGLTTDHCVSTTTRMAGNLGFETYLVADATATFDKTGFDGQHYPAALIHATALASLHGEFATVLTTDQAVEQVRARLT